MAISSGKLSSGFTLIELLISFAVIGVLAAISTVSFVTYNQSQALSNSAKDIQQMLTVAKSRAQSQVKPDSCQGALLGYVFRTCGSGAECKTEGDYEVVGSCNDENGVQKYVESLPRVGEPVKKLPSGVSFNQSSLGQTYEFPILTGGVINTQPIILTGPNNARKTITIDGQGNINEE